MINDFVRCAAVAVASVSTAELQAWTPLDGIVLAQAIDPKDCADAVDEQLYLRPLAKSTIELPILTAMALEVLPPGGDRWDPLASGTISSDRQEPLGLLDEVALATAIERLKQRRLLVTDDTMR